MVINGKFAGKEISTEFGPVAFNAIGEGVGSPEAEKVVGKMFGSFAKVEEDNTPNTPNETDDAEKPAEGGTPAKKKPKSKKKTASKKAPAKKKDETQD